MPAALKWKSKVILAKVETTYNVDPTPTQAILTKNVVCRPMEGEDVSREIERPFFGGQDMFPTGLHVVIEFDVELVGSGTAGTAPPFGPLLRACRLAETVSAGVSVTYSPITNSQESGALYFWIGGNKQAILGVRGTAVLNIDAQGIPTIHFTLTGLWAAPAATATPSIDLSAFKTPLVATNVNTPIMTVNAVSLVTKSFAFDLGNVAQPRLLIGREEILIVDANPEISVTVEAVPLATLNPFTLAKALTRVAVAATHDTRAGYICSIAAPTSSVRRPTGYENDQGDLMWPLKLAPLPTDAGNDEFTITFT